jgi:hypothetical protein
MGDDGGLLYLVIILIVLVLVLGMMGKYGYF